MAKLIGLFRNQTGIVHALKKDKLQTLCGKSVNQNEKVFWSGSSHVNCRTCLKIILKNNYPIVK
jgi:hypothetical protein